MRAISLGVHYECEFEFPHIRADHYIFLLFGVIERVYSVATYNFILIFIALLLARVVALSWMRSNKHSEMAS